MVELEDGILMIGDSEYRPISDITDDNGINYKRFQKKRSPIKHITERKEIIIEPFENVSFNKITGLYRRKWVTKCRTK